MLQLYSETAEHFLAYKYVTDHRVVDSDSLFFPQVTGGRNNEVSTLIPYHDIPISCSENPGTLLINNLQGYT